jgi:hypothetical protein
VVILVPAHLRFLFGLIRNLNAATKPFDEFVIVASGFKTIGRAFVSLLALTLRGGSVRMLFPGYGSAGQNRNLGMDVATSELICFLDIDDFYGTDRTRLIADLYSQRRFDVCYHSYERFRGLPIAVELFQGTSLLHVDWLENADLRPIGNRSRALELKGLGTSTNLRVRNPEKEFPIHHAHVTVRRQVIFDVGLRFHEVAGVPNEDGVFANDALEAKLIIFVSCAPLSLYREGNSIVGNQRPRLLAGVALMVFKRLLSGIVAR